jgi:hypothetical protein
MAEMKGDWALQLLLLDPHVIAASLRILVKGQGF